VRTCGSVQVPLLPTPHGSPRFRKRRPSTSLSLGSGGKHRAPHMRVLVLAPVVSKARSSHTPNRVQPLPGDGPEPPRSGPRRRRSPWFVSAALSSVPPVVIDRVADRWRDWLGRAPTRGDSHLVHRPDFLVEVQHRHLAAVNLAFALRADRGANSNDGTPRCMVTPARDVRRCTYSPAKAILRRNSVGLADE